jgi:hypothetical protein
MRNGLFGEGWFPALSEWSLPVWLMKARTNGYFQLMTGFLTAAGKESPDRRPHNGNDADAVVNDTITAGAKKIGLASNG